MAMTIRSAAPLDAATAMPMTLLMKHLKDPQDDEAIVDAARLGALDWIEKHVGRSLSRRLWVLTPSVRALDTSAIALPMGPVFEITDVRYSSAGSPDAVWSADSYRQDGDVLRTASGLTWRAAFSRMSMSVTYVAGYADLGAEAPALLTAALMLAGHFYRNREENAAVVMSSMPFGVRMLCEPYRQPVLA